MNFYLGQSIFVYRTIVLFFIFSFMGWIIELIYRSITNRRVVNPGYLYGPLVPIYGFGGIVIMMAGIFLKSFSIPVQMFAFGLLTTSLELFVGIAIEKILGYRLWSYEGYRFSFKGIICLRYALIWAGFSWIFYYFIFPVTYLSLCKVPHQAVQILAAVLPLYLCVDLVLSTLAMLDFFRKIRSLYAGISSFSNADLQQLTLTFRRLLGAFPELGHFMEKAIHDGVSTKFNSLLTKLSVPARSLKGRKKLHHIESEYMEIVSDILANAEYRKLQNFYHHSTTIYEHLQYVSYLSYRMAKSLGLDYRSTARGALLHDFFLYDWRTHDEPDLPKNKNHGLAHPRIALENARRHFKLNKVEEDIIIKHMWPLTFLPPRYMESYVVTFADKFSASREYTVRLKDFFVLRALRRRTLGK